MLEKEKLNILLVEDNEGDIRLIQESFKPLEGCCDFKVARDGKEALDYLKTIQENNYKQLPDFIILDINLPKVSGLEVLEEIKKDVVMSIVPTIIFTSSSAHNDIRSAYSHHANSYIEKPAEFVDYENVFRMVWEYWGKLVKLPLRTGNGF